MEIDGSSPWINLRNGVQRLGAQRQMKIASGNGGMCPDWDPMELPAPDVDFFRFKELIRSIPDIREERVTQARDDIEGGTYNVIAERIAEKIMGSDLLDSFL